MHIIESNDFQIQRIMARESLDYEEAREFLRDLMEEGDDYDYNYDERCGLGDCFGDAL
jgi:predicted transcriptional regulator